jgi:filamentous hemagglutinin
MPPPSAATALLGQDLGIALTQNIVNNGEVAANGNLTYTTTGNFTNNGKLLAGGRSRWAATTSTTPPARRCRGQTIVNAAVRLPTAD